MNYEMRRLPGTRFNYALGWHASERTIYGPDGTYLGTVRLETARAGRGRRWRAVAGLVDTGLHWPTLAAAAQGLADRTTTLPVGPR